ncbi:M12 family metallo-peptidase [Aquimonas voraii]|uniref:Peptidyl-Asp metalloendopeptidase Metallo peptidase. MEROPS family M72 n=1 Tax=Aquimonas voraii TaxID=265719 RepID=A0A1G6UAW1_9GAMM|nr:M12 family metallo-peptidase [Aquimonas voraii]SDD38374.1 peptidyl-Asp metalloendopeptidase Metallo peptidase. MEROPS family M72 [Aquimonas voraii]
MNFHRYAAAMLAVSCAFSGAAQAQQELFSTIGNREAFAAPGPLLQRVAADRANARIELVAADAGAVHARQGALRMTLPGGIAIEAKQSRHQQLPSGNELWIGRVDMKAQGPNTSRLQAIDHVVDEAILVRSGEELWGTIRVAGALYRLQPVDKGAHALIEVDQQAFPPDEHEEAYKEMVAKSQPVDFRSGSPLATPKAISTIRVMVAFGPAARAAISNPQAAVDLAFAESNQALAATGTEIVFQQAGAIQNYSQAETTNYSTMLSRLTNLSDGFYDTIGSQRNSNTADIVAYVAPVSSGLCGQAAGIATSNANAYFVMNPSCLSGNYTFVHEAAHVVGARHDNDPTLTPYAYGHGYVITSQNRRTVMAVNNGPCSTCTRIGAFSSPNFSIGGVAIGTTTRNDNTRVWKTRGPTVAAFR